MRATTKKTLVSDDKRFVCFFLRLMCVINNTYRNIHEKRRKKSISIKKLPYLCIRSNKKLVYSVCVYVEEKPKNPPFTCSI